MKFLVRRLTVAMALTSLTVLSGCKPEYTIENCFNADDCFPGERCIAGLCVPPNVANDGGTDDVGADAGADVSMAAVAQVVVSPEDTTLDLLEQVQLSAALFDEDGNALSGRSVTWSSSNSDVAEVDEEGTVKALTQGTVTITAVAEGVEGAATVNVVKKNVASVLLAPSRTSLGIGASLQLIATVRDANDDALQGREIVWGSSDDGIAIVSTTGLATAVGEGQATITAYVEGIEGTSQITVVPDPVDTITLTPTSTQVELNGTAQLIAQPLDEDGNELSDRTIVWGSANTGVATVDDQGIVSGVSLGTTTITATSEGKSATADVEVIPQPVALVEVTPTSADLLPTETLQISATPKASDGTELTDRSISWMSDDSAVATVDNTGLITAVAPGTTTVTATSETAFAPISVTVRVPIATVEVSGDAAGGDVGDEIAFTATPKDAGGASLTGRSCTFSSDDTNVATVDASTGLATIAGEGDTAIVATCEGIMGSTAIAGYGDVATVNITPTAPAPIGVAGTVQFIAELLDSSGHTLSGRSIIWDTSTPANVSVNGAGLATGVAVGTSDITAISENVTSNAVTVTVE